MHWQLFGPKTCSVFDAWSFEHVLSGCSIGHLLRQTMRDKRQQLLALGVIAFAWEVLEHYLEEGLAGHNVALWFHGVEFWANRLLADPTMMLLGWATAERRPGFVIWARVMSLAWLALHVFAFPHSMWLQDQLSYR